MSYKIKEAHKDFVTMTTIYTNNSNCPQAEQNIMTDLSLKQQSHEIIGLYNQIESSYISIMFIQNSFEKNSELKQINCNTVNFIIKAPVEA